MEKNATRLVEARTRLAEALHSALGSRMIHLIVLNKNQRKSEERVLRVAVILKEEHFDWERDNALVTEIVEQVGAELGFKFVCDTVAHLQYSREEYLALEAGAPKGRRWEYRRGRMYLLGGASPERGDLTHNISVALGNRLVGRDCRVRHSVQRVRIGEDYLYPDVVAFCSDGEYTDETPPSLLNPWFIAEVDLWARIEDCILFTYREAPSVKEIWVCSTGEVRIDQYVRSGDANWRIISHRSLDAKLYSPTFLVEIALNELYEHVL